MRVVPRHRLSRLPRDPASGIAASADEQMTGDTSDGTPQVITSAASPPRVLAGLGVYERAAHAYVGRARHAVERLSEHNRARAIVAVAALLAEAERLSALDAERVCVDRTERFPATTDFRRALPLVADALAQLAAHAERATPFRPVTAYTLDHQIVRMLGPTDSERVRAKVYDAAARVVAASPLLRSWEALSIEEWERGVADLAYVIEVVVWLSSGVDLEP